MGQSHVCTFFLNLSANQSYSKRKIICKQSSPKIRLLSRSSLIREPLVCFLCKLFIDNYMHGSRKLCQSGSNIDKFFLVDEEREDQNITISGPSSARQRNAI